MVDLSYLLNKGNEPPDRKTDLSGKKKPKNVRAILNSGIEVPCEVQYDGQAEDDPRMRRYLVKAECDWSKYWIKTLLVGECSVDVRIIVLVPNTTSAEHRQYAATMQTIFEKRV
jgi:hypothetical protein